MADPAPVIHAWENVMKRTMCGLRDRYALITAPPLVWHHTTCKRCKAAIDRRVKR